MNMKLLQIGKNYMCFEQYYNLSCLGLAPHSILTETLKKTLDTYLIMWYH